MLRIWNFTSGTFAGSDLSGLQLAVLQSSSENLAEEKTKSGDAVVYLPKSATLAQREALLGWLNATVHLERPAGFDANEFLRDLALEIQHRLQTEKVEIAHLKMTLNPDTGLNEIAVINLVRSDFIPELSQTLEENIQGGELIVNLRAEGAPAILHAALRNALETVAQPAAGLVAEIEHVEHFRPGKPQPTHRLTTVG